MRRVLGLAAGVAVATAYFVVSALPAFSAETGTVNLRITAASPCISLSNYGGPTDVDFGTKAFSTPSKDEGASKTGYFLANCSSISEQVYARGSDATGTNGGAEWSLVAPTQSPPNPCGEGIDKYFLNAVTTVSPTNVPSVYLTKSNQSFFSPEPSTLFPIQNGLAMPCSGSSGAGQTMNLQITYTAAF